MHGGAGISPSKTLNPLTFIGPLPLQCITQTWREDDLALRCKLLLSVTCALCQALICSMSVEGYLCLVAPPSLLCYVSLPPDHVSCARLLPLLAPAQEPSRSALIIVLQPYFL